MVKRGQLTIERAQSFAEDPDDEVKTEAFRFLVEQDAAIDPENISFKLPDDYLRHWSRKMITRSRPLYGRRDIVLSYYRRFTFEQLMQQIAWDQPAGHDAYLALAVDHFERFGDRVRSDLGNDFCDESKRHYERKLAEWERIVAYQTPTSAVGPSLTAALFGWHPTKESTPAEHAQSMVDMQKRDYIVAALAALVRHGEADDVRFAREFLDNSDNEVRLEAVQLLRKFGNSADVPGLLKIALNNSGLAQELAAQAALELADKEYEVSTELLNTQDELLISLTVSHLTSGPVKAETAEFLKPSLENPNDKLRTRVMAFFILKYTHEELATLLAEYLGKETYYYDVVCCFDRALYAPPPFATHYRKLVESDFFGLLDNAAR